MPETIAGWVVFVLFGVPAILYVSCMALVLAAWVCMALWMPVLFLLTSLYRSIRRPKPSPAVVVPTAPDPEPAPVVIKAPVTPVEETEDRFTLVE